MGFSLKAFFEDLEWTLKTPDFRDDEARIEAIKELVKNEKAYAEECGQLR